MSAVDERVVLVEVHPTSTPAAELPAGLLFDVRQVLAAHGLDPEPVEVLLAMMEVVRHTAAERGGTRDRAHDERRG